MSIIGDPYEAFEATGELIPFAVRGPHGAITVDAETIARLDLRPSLSTSEACKPDIEQIAARAYLGSFGDEVWPDPMDCICLMKLVGEPKLLLVTTEFEHTQGDLAHIASKRREPGWCVPVSESDCYLSLADVIVQGDPSRFRPGESNTDWRLHAIFSEGEEGFD